MQVIVPLAGPDFISSGGLIKGLSHYEGKPIIDQALSNRPWYNSVKNYTFVLKECEEARNFYFNHLCRNYPNSSAVYLSCFSQGAALSALAGISLNQDFSDPLIIDLADIIYTSNINVTKFFADNLDSAGLALAFKSSNPCYSYLECSTNGDVIQSAEKRVISEYASVGTYVFRDCSIYLRALAHILGIS